MEPPESGRGRRGAVVAVALVVAALAVVGVVLAVLLPGGGPRREPASPPRATTPLSPSSVPAPAPSPPLGPPRGEQFGINVNRLFNGREYTAAQIDAQLRDVAATGATVARSDALWEVTEPRPPVGGLHHYDWAFDDLIAGSLAAHGLRWLALLDYSALWAESVPGQDHSAPRSDRDFAAFAAAVAGRYGTSGSFWSAHPGLSAAPATTFEVWNEPDNPSFWRPAPSAAGYAELYTTTRAAIAAVDPSARVIVGGLSNPTSFLPALMAAHPDLAGHLDGVAIHPYGATPAVVLGRLRAARRTLSSLGLGGVPLDVTEFGWTTHPAGALNFAPEARRGGYVEATVAELGHTDCGIDAALLYTWVTPGSAPSNPQDWYGLRVGGAGASPMVDQMADHSQTDVQAFAAGLRRAASVAPAAAICR